MKLSIYKDARNLFKKWIIHQLYAGMTIENYGSVWEIDHCFPYRKVIYLMKEKCMSLLI